MAGTATIAAGIERRAAIMRFIKSYHRKNRISPSIEEIADGVGLSSKATVRHHLDILVTEGKLVRDPGKYRTLRLPQR